MATELCKQDTGSGHVVQCVQYTPEETGKIWCRNSLWEGLTRDQLSRVRVQFSDISGSHDGEYEDESTVGHSAV
jgi:hypothetical protein